MVIPVWSVWSVYGTSGGCLRVVLWMFLGVSVGCRGGVWRVSGGCVEGIWGVSCGCLTGVNANGATRLPNSQLLQVALPSSRFSNRYKCVPSGEQMGTKDGFPYVASLPVLAVLASSFSVLAARQSYYLAILLRNYPIYQALWASSSKRHETRSHNQLSSLGFEFFQHLK